MKRKISDLLDGYRVDTLEPECNAPLSSQRIKEMTMGKIKKNNKVRRLGVRVLVAAAIIMSLSVTAFAAEKIFGAGDMFRDILNLQLEADRTNAQEDGLDITIQETLSEGQVQVINSLGTVFEEQSYTDQGTTVTATAAYCDEYMLYLYLSVTAPEGTVLPDGILYTFYDYNASGTEDFQIGDLGGNAPYHAGFTSLEVSPMPDADPTDNQKDFKVAICAQPGEETKFNDGYTKFLPIMGIYQQVVNVDGDQDGYELIAPGKFEIDLTLSHPVEEVELDVKGLEYGGHKTRTWTHDSPCIPACDAELTGETDPETGLPIHSESWEYSVTAKSFKITPMSATWECSYSVSDKQRSCSLDFQVVMKDGTSPMLISVPGGLMDNGKQRMGTLYFTVPINLEDIDYILIGDPEVGQTHKVYLPETR